ncbi:unnamed protein product, partial [Effrenium voratum]
NPPKRDLPPLPAKDLNGSLSLSARASQTSQRNAPLIRSVEPTMKPDVVCDEDYPPPCHWRSIQEKLAWMTATPEADESANRNVSVCSPSANSAFSKLADLAAFTGTSTADEHSAGRLAQCLERASPYVDRVGAVMVILNALAMLLEFELSGQSAGSHLGLSTGWPLSSTMPVFRGISATFDVVFFLELAVRVAIERRRFLKELYFIIMTTPADQMSWLLNACQSFVVSLCWSMVLLGVVMIAASLVIGNLLQDYIRDDNVGFDDRVWVWQYYGTAYRSWYTLYEITFAGSWPTMARPVLEKVSHGFVCFYVLYITIIVFALIRVITAVFLKDTLDAAHNDAELRMAEGLRKKAEYVEKLAGIFQAIDETGDGLITEERLTFILENPKVKAYFQTLDVDVHEGAALFHILDDGDGECTLEEFIGGKICFH